MVMLLSRRVDRIWILGLSPGSPGGSTAGTDLLHGRGQPSQASRHCWTRILEVRSPLGIESIIFGFGCCLNSARVHGRKRGFGRPAANRNLHDHGANQLCYYTGGESHPWRNGRGARKEAIDTPVPSKIPSLRELLQSNVGYAQDTDFDANLRGRF